MKVGTRTQWTFLALLLIAAGITYYYLHRPKELKLYWFIPDGMRADPGVFDVFEWARSGDLPNIKKMMDQGSYGYCIPVFPSHTPTNFATLLTGAYPKTHGVADGPMHTEGNPLNRVSIGGFNSAAKKIPPIWVTLEKEYNKKVILLSIPGSTPPELARGITIRGRWGGWGADFHATNFQSELDQQSQSKPGRKTRLFFFGPKLTQYISASEPEGWGKPPKSYSPAKEIHLENYGATVYGYIYDSTDNNRLDYDRISFSSNKSEIFVDLKKGDWSGWIPITLKWKVQDQESPIQTSFKIKVIKLEKDGFFRIRFLYNLLNPNIVQPPYTADELNEGVGPMVDFVDNFPGQLVYYKEDKAAFLEEADMGLEWHKKAASFILKHYKPDVFINDIYTPNQILESRWWMGYLDPQSSRYNEVSESERKELWNDVKHIYKRLDEIVGQMLQNTDPNTLVVLSSDHGLVPLDKSVRLNNLFAEKGWFKFSIDPKSGEPLIDWDNSKVVYLKMDNIYIHPQGLGGNWKRASGKEYEELRDQVIETLKGLQDPETGIKPVEVVCPWEEVEKRLNLPTDRVGDLVIANRPGYGWDEEMTEDRKIFHVPEDKTGYKQAVIATDLKGMWAPFIIMGPGVKKGYELKEPILMVDQYPTIMRLMKKKIPPTAEGKVLSEIFE